MFADQRAAGNQCRDGEEDKATKEEFGIVWD